MRPERIHLKELRTFLAVIRNETFAGAAKEMAVSAATVTAQIKQLEETMECRLLSRTTRRVQLTDAGLVLAKQATRIMYLLNTLPEKMNQLKNLEAGEVKVGIISSAKYVIPKLLGRFRKQHPGLKLHITIGNREQILTQLQQEEIHLAIMGQTPATESLESFPLMAHQLVFIASPDHPLSDLDRVTLDDLMAETMILREVGSGTRLSAARFLGDQMQRFHEPPMVMNSSESIKQAVIAGLGLSLLSDVTCELEFQNGILTTLPVEGTPIQRQWYVVRSRRSEYNAGELALLEHLLASAKLQGRHKSQ
jgi:DNA-binding transcriptional LysR family regulator